MKAIVHISLKDGVLDPQGKAIGNALTGLGFANVEDVRQGKYIELTLDPALGRDEAEKSVRDMCEKLLANTVIETYRIDFAA
jgi:phosphoribosylformylglycinamidine synthase